jgi:hypothetical protein
MESLAAGKAGADVVRTAEVEEKVRELMDVECKAAKRMLERAAWAQQAAKSAVSHGGTSATALLKLVEELHDTYDDGVVGKCVNSVQNDLSSNCVKLVFRIILPVLLFGLATYVSLASMVSSQNTNQSTLSRCFDN